jgi:hypothetical protein
LTLLAKWTGYDDFHVSSCRAVVTPGPAGKSVFTQGLNAEISVTTSLGPFVVGGKVAGVCAAAAAASIEHSYTHTSIPPFIPYHQFHDPRDARNQHS